MREKIHGFIVNFDDSLRHTGFRYLRDDLQTNEARVFFDAARMKGRADFEDDGERQFTLIYNRSDGTYDLERR